MSPTIYFCSDTTLVRTYLNGISDNRVHATVYPPRGTPVGVCGSTIFANNCTAKSIVICKKTTGTFVDSFTEVACVTPDTAFALETNKVASLFNSEQCPDSATVSAWNQWAKDETLVRVYLKSSFSYIGTIIAFGENVIVLRVRGDDHITKDVLLLGISRVTNKG